VGSWNGCVFRIHSCRRRESFDGTRDWTFGSRVEVPCRRIGNLFKEEGLRAPDSRIRMKAILHNIIIQEIVESKKAHSLMMSHISVDNDTPIAFALFLECSQLIRRSL
jgi:hypothetical protein